MDEAKGEYHCDCSALAGLVLKKIAPAAYEKLPRSSPKKRPLAVHFHTAISEASADPKSARDWLRVASVAEMKPGDLLVWRKLEVETGESTGHVMIVDEAPVKDSNGEFRVVVIDSTESPHGSDTRRDGANGVGRGTIWLKAGEQGAPIGYRWRSTRSKLQTDDPIAIGRVLDATALSGVKEEGGKP